MNGKFYVIYCKLDAPEVVPLAFELGLGAEGPRLPSAVVGILPGPGGKAEQRRGPHLLRALPQWSPWPSSWGRALWVRGTPRQCRVFLPAQGVRPSSGEILFYCVCAPAVVPLAFELGQGAVGPRRSSAVSGILTCPGGKS
jgi:hypothetical protein